MGLFSKVRNVLYTSAKTLGDVQAVKEGKVITRVKNRIKGKIVGRFLSKF
jgi:hypothetical protein